MNVTLRHSFTLYIVDNASLRQTRYKKLNAELNPEKVIIIRKNIGKQ